MFTGFSNTFKGGLSGYPVKQLNHKLIDCSHNTTGLVKITIHFLIDILIPNSSIKPQTKISYLHFESFPWERKILKYRNYLKFVK